MATRAWGWRSRVRDPRYAGLVVMALEMAAGFALLGRKHLAPSLVGAGFVLVSAALVGLVSLPPWRDPKHSPAAGGLILAAGGLIALIACVALTYGAGVTWSAASLP